MSAAATLSSEALHPLIDLAFEIADSAARSDVECHCAHHSGDAATGWWYDTTKIDDLAEGWREELDKSIHYCEQRGLLKRMPGAPHVVGFERLLEKSS